MTYKTPEAAVIDEDLLKKAVLDQISADVPESIRKEATDPLDIFQLRLDYKSNDLLMYPR